MNYAHSGMPDAIICVAGGQGVGIYCLCSAGILRLQVFHCSCVAPRLQLTSI